MEDLTWGDVSDKHLKASKELDKFFLDLQNGKIINPTGVRVTYRRAQNDYAVSVLKAIRDKEILLIEAGVGTGKSFGYLLPIFYTMKNVRSFQKVIISTSSIALQEQLIGDIARVSELVGFNIKTEISKGINNYACLKNVKLAIESSKLNHDTEAIKTFQRIQRAITEFETCDKAELPQISNAFWQRIQMNGGCDICDLKSKCEFLKGQVNIGTSPIVITNHTQLVNLLNREEADSDLVVIDESHKLEEEMRLISQDVLNPDELVSRIYDLKYTLEDAERYDAFYEVEKLQVIADNTFDNMKEFVKQLKINAQNIYSRSNNGRTDMKEVDKLVINLGNEKIRTSLKKLIVDLTPFKNVFKYSIPVRGVDKEAKIIKDYIKILQDMYLNYESKNIYWINYTDKNHIEIVYTEKSLKQTYEKLYGKDRPVVFTSGTMSANGKYNRMISSLNLDTNINLRTNDPIKSPFDYENNTIFYYDPDMINPNDPDRTKYIADIANKVKQLIEITEGKALVLFTSKSDMKAVYNAVKGMDLKLNLILQEDKNVSKWKEAFRDDENACLFATGAFWEGIDLKGKTLSNLIVVRLPFPVLDPVVEYKKRGLDKKGVSRLLIDEMLVKLAQGTGRLIRSSTDTGVVCCLDSRVPKVLGSIKSTLPFTNYTTDLNEVVNFADKKILGKIEGNNPFIIEPADKEN